MFNAPLFETKSQWRPPETLPDLRDAKRLAIDLETYDPDLKALGPGTRRNGYIVGIAVGTDTGIRTYLPIKHQGGDNLDSAMVTQWAREELNAFTGYIVGANLIYDLDYLANIGVTFPHAKGFLDVQIAEPLLDENKFSYSLDVLAKEYIGEHKNEGTLRAATASFGVGGTDAAVKSNIWKLPARFVGAYAEGDVDLPLRILPLQEQRLASEGLSELFDLECRLIPLLLAMRRRGVRVDLRAVDQARDYLKDQGREALAQVQRLAGARAEINRPTTLVNALHERGIYPDTTPKSGAPSITAEFLERHSKDELCRAIRRGRQVEKVLSTFVDGLTKHLVGDRVHPNFHQLRSDNEGTIARFSCTNPNLQNQPARDEELGPLIRGLFVPEECELWESDDYSQIEYRYLAHYAVGPGSDECRRQYNEDPKTDFHKLVARWLKSDPEDSIRRKKVKTINFAKGYGAQANRLAEQMGCSVEEAQEFMDIYDRELPFAKKTFDLMQQVAANRGYVKTILNRRRRFDLWEPRQRGGGYNKPLPLEQARIAYGNNLKRSKTYAAMSGVLQGGAADLMKKAMVDAWEAGIFSPKALGAPLVTVHDELGLSVPQHTEGDEAAKFLRYTMENAIKLKVPILVKAKRGISWGACE